MLYFQLWQSHGGAEKFHGAVIEHVGHGDTRAFREVKSLGSELTVLGDRILHGQTPAEVAIYMDWNSWWALDASGKPSIELDYVQQLIKAYRPAWRRGAGVDFVGPESDLSGYKLLVVPLA